MLKKRLYRSLLRVSANMDRNPVLKVFVTSDLRDAIAGGLGGLNEQGELADVVSKALSTLARENCSGGMLYKPGQSLKSIVRKSFREPSIRGLKLEDRLDLGLEAFKYLSRCNSIGSNICVNPIVTEAKSLPQPPPPVLIPSDRVEEGSLLIAHPLIYQSSFSQCCIVIAQHDEEKKQLQQQQQCSSLGFVLNQPMNCTLGDKLSLETQRKYPYVKEFLACPLYRGGEVMTPQPLTLLHRSDYLSFCSKSISISSSSSSVPATAPAATVTLTTATSTSTAATAATSTTTAATTTAASSTTGSSNVECMREDIQMMPHSIEPSHTLYYTQDLKTVSEAIAKGRVSASDFKVVLGFTGWGAGQLQGEVDMNAWFVAKGANVVLDLALWKGSGSGCGSDLEPTSSSRCSGSGTTTQEEQLQQPQPSLSPPLLPVAGRAIKKDEDCRVCESPHKNSEDYDPDSDSDINTNEHKSHNHHDWGSSGSSGSGRMTWQQVLRCLGGEYAHFAQCADLTELRARMSGDGDRAATLKELSALSLYGLEATSRAYYKRN